MTANFNDVSVGEIERRCRPFVGVYDSEESARVPEEQEFVELLRSMRSHCGFLAFDESLTACIAADAANCTALNVTAVQIGAALRAIVNSFEASTSANVPKGPFATRDIPCDVALRHLPNVSVAVTSTLLVTRIESRGYQRSPFVNLDSDTPDSAWNVEYHILNKNLVPGNVTLKIGGNSTFGSLQFIDQFSFFGGGGGVAALRATDAKHPPVVNEYRLDPAIVVAVLTGGWNALGKAALVASLQVERLRLAPQLVDAVNNVEQCTTIVNERKEALARASAAGEDCEMAELELDEARGELAFAQQTKDFVHNVQLKQLDDAVSALQ